MTVNSDVLQNYRFVLEQINKVAKDSERDPRSVKLLAVSKKQPAEKIQVLIDHYPGVMLGENYVQEFADKAVRLKGSFQAHLIGPLQSNKVRKAVAIFDVIQSVGSIKLATLISNEANKINKTQQIYLQVNISQDEGKSGFTSEELIADFLQIQSLPNIEILGLMTITRYYSKMTDVLPDFDAMFNLRRLLCQQTNQELSLSMGMSADYRLAVQAGANLVRVGTDIFGLR